MSTITSKDGTQIYYKDWGRGPAVLFCHGWPLNADAWDSQMSFLMKEGFRVIAHDRRGHGRSEQASSGNDMNTYADDLATLMQALHLGKAALVGHGIGGGEILRLVGRHGTRRVAKIVLVSACTPAALREPAALSALWSSLIEDRSQYYKDLAATYYGVDSGTTGVSQGLLDQFWLWGMQAGLRNVYESIKAFSTSDHAQDLRKVDIPTLILQGTEDRIAPAGVGKGGDLRVEGARQILYHGAPHGLTATHHALVNRDLLEFLRS